MVFILIRHGNTAVMASNSSILTQASSEWRTRNNIDLTVTYYPQISILQINADIFQTLIIMYNHKWLF